MMTIILPWPSSNLSPNSRGAWYTHEADRKQAKQTGYLSCLTHLSSSDPLPDRLQMTITFHPPTRARFDLDNLHNRCKYYQDGIFQALGRDDNDITRVVLERGKPLKGGSVTIILGEVEG